MAFGIALDLGTSGYRSHLVDLETGKILETAVTARHPLPGVNVMDHIDFWMMSGKDVTHKIIMQTIYDLIRLYGKANLAEVRKVAVCGNPIQLSLFENIEVRDLAFAGENKIKNLGVESPSRKAHVTTAGDIGIFGIDAESDVIIPPTIKHEIGADALAMIIKSGILDRKEPSLVTDYGTNAEMALYYDGEIYSGSAAAGPAIEGQSVKQGVVACPRAISDVSALEDGAWENSVLDEQLIPVVTSTVDPLTGSGIRILDYRAKGITGTGVVATIAEGLRTGIIAQPYINTPDHKIHLADRMNIDVDDIRNAGRSMGAIHTGHRVLMDNVGLTDGDVKVMFMSGAAGTYIDPIKAQYCGMIPRGLDEIYQIGNTSLMMAHDLLKSDESLDKMQEIADSLKANHVMFAGNKKFEDMYVLDLSYWDEGMPYDMYNKLMVAAGFSALPEITEPKICKKLVKADIPDIGSCLHTLNEAGMILEGKFEGCNGCRKCQFSCPQKALKVFNDRDGFQVNIRSDLCNGTVCHTCTAVCPKKVLDYTKLQVHHIN